MSSSKSSVRLIKPEEKIVFISAAEFAEITGLSESTIRRKFKAGELPSPYRLSSRLTRWDKRDVLNWLQHTKEEASQP